MKKIAIMFCAAAAMCGAYAQFKDDAIDVTTAAEVKAMSNNSWVMMEGYIVKRLGEEKYTFRDDSGEITVLVANSTWQGTEVTPKVKVRLTGKIKCFLYWFKKKVEVDKVLILKSNSGN
jgi:uncharacterized protein (TIGR00156 family)